MVLLGVDIGTTGAKAIVFNLDGNILGYGFQEYGITTGLLGYAEQDAQEVWQVAKSVIQKAIKESGQKTIEAMSYSVQGDAVIPVDKEYCPLHPAILGMDYRTVEEAKQCSDLFGDRALYQETGMRPHPMNSLTKILWLKQHKPEIYEKTYRFVTYADFLLGKLGVDGVIDYTMASRTMAFSLEAKSWSEDILKGLGIDKEKLSKPVPSGRGVGWLSDELTKEWELTAPMAIVAGGHDQTCAALGAGLIEENIALDSHGTAEVLSTAFYSKNTGDKMYHSYYPCYIHTVGDMYFTFSLNHIGGILFKWFRDEFGYEEMLQAKETGQSAYALMLDKISIDPGHVMVLPHFNGSGTPWCDLESKGAFVGITMGTKKSDFTKGIIDSLAYELKINLETMRDAGIPVNALRCVGGAAQSEKWLQIKADITGCTVSTLRIREAACLGAALLAGTAAGGYESLSEAVKKTVKVDKAYYPDEKRSKRYDEKYQIYRELYSSLKEINKKL